MADKDEAPKPNTENFDAIVENAFVAAEREPLSTFSASVDTASYSIVRAKINAGELPPKDAVRLADMLNYFPYDYPTPKGVDPVAIGLELAPCPWNAKHNLLRIALQARKHSPSDMPARNLVFLIDTSGSMSPENRLPLVKKSVEMVVEQLTARDRVSIVTYAGVAGLALDSTPGDKHEQILRVVRGLGAGGSTNGAGGITVAYDQATRNFIEGGVNRVILATDGDFNVGVASEGELKRIIEDKRQTGVYLTVLGYGMGNLQDAKLETLAHHGNGHYAYIDSEAEARKVFVDQGAAIETVAKDVKLQVEFNPAMVGAYRLIGYENRLLRPEDFRDDAKDAGDMGSGHACTALYEVVPAGVEVALPKVPDLKYSEKPKPKAGEATGEWLTVQHALQGSEDREAERVCRRRGQGRLAQGGVERLPVRVGRRGVRPAAARFGVQGHGQVRRRHRVGRGQRRPRSGRLAAGIRRPRQEGSGADEVNAYGRHALRTPRHGHSAAGSSTASGQRRPDCTAHSQMPSGIQPNTRV